VARPHVSELSGPPSVPELGPSLPEEDSVPPVPVFEEPWVPPDAVVSAPVSVLPPPEPPMSPLVPPVSPL